MSSDIHAASDDKETIIGKIYELGEKDSYEIDKAEDTNEKAKRFNITGDISQVSTKDGVPSYSVNSGNLKIYVDEEYKKELYKPDSNKNWHIIEDKGKSVDAVKLPEKINTGAIIVQTSRDKKAWVTVDIETDIYAKMSSINNRTLNGEQIGAFYKTTNIQITNGCFFRILVVYKMQKETDASQILFVQTKEKETKEQIEEYVFYAFNPNVDQQETPMDTENYHVFGAPRDIYRVDSPEGFERQEKLKSDDPHNDWSVGKFYISGYTDKLNTNEDLTFLKMPGDRIALWFNLENELDKCHGNTDIKIEYTSKGSDREFGTPTINNWGKGTLIIIKTDKNNKSERQIYTNYLEASAAVGANTRIDLFEEGDYEVTLDYQLHFNKPFVFGSKTTKTLVI